MIRRPPRSTRTDTLFPYTTLFRSNDHDPFEVLLNAKKQARGVTIDTDLTADDLRELVGEYKALIRERTGRPFPVDPPEQLWGAIGAVFSSWETPRAAIYCAMHGYPDWWGTAGNGQAGVFGHRPAERRDRIECVSTCISPG